MLPVTSQKEGAVVAGPIFLNPIGDDLLKAVVSENLPGEDLNILVGFGCLTLLNGQQYEGALNSDQPNQLN